jgi:hypothetical protein
MHFSPKHSSSNYSFETAKSNSPNYYSFESSSPTLIKDENFDFDKKVLDHRTLPKYDLIKEPQRQRTFSNAFSSTNQGLTNHCVAFSICELLTKKIAEIIPLEYDEWSELYMAYLSRMSCVLYKNGVNQNFLSLFIHELNNGLGKTHKTESGSYLVRAPTHFRLDFDADIFSIAFPLELKHPYTLTKNAYKIIKKVIRALSISKNKMTINTLDVMGFGINTHRFIEFIGNNFVMVSILISGENEKMLMKVPANGIIRFNPNEPYKKMLSHAMFVRGVKVINGIPMLELYNSWGPEWGIEMETDNNRGIRVGYFELSDEIINNFIQKITYLSITPTGGLRKMHSIKKKKNKKNKKTIRRLK